MKKIALNMLICCMFTGIAYASELEQASIQPGAESSPEFVVLKADGEEASKEDLQKELEDALRDEPHELNGQVASSVHDDSAVLESRQVEDETKNTSVVERVASVLKPHESKKDESEWNPTIRDYRLSLAGALLGGYAAALLQDSYGTKGSVIFSVLTSAAAVAVRTKKDISIKNQCLMGGFVSGAQIPLVFVLFKRRR